MNWSELEVAAPQIARLGKQRLVAARVALLGTLRKDGSPRISPVEPYFSDDELIFGAMSWTLKARDLRRDPRCVLHSAISQVDSGEGELKLYGRATEADEHVVTSCEDAWWRTRPDAAVVFAFDIDQATFIGWDLVQGAVTIRRWSPRSGYSERSRSYP